MDEKYDAALMGILQHEGKIEKFIDVIFGFLMRRTDFFYEYQEGSKLGFPKGMALQLVVQAFNKYDTFFKEYQQKNAPKSGTKKESNADQEKVIPKPKTEEPKMNDGDSKPSSSTKKPKSAEKSKPAEPSKQKSSEVKSDAPSTENPPENNAPETEKRVVRVAPGTLFKREENGERIYEAEPDCYNGARRENYSWSQKHREIDIQINIPEHIKSAKQLIVKIEKKHIKICEKGVDTPIIDSELSHEIKTEFTNWSFDADEHSVTINLDKVQEYWWDAAFVGEDKINVQEIDCSQPIHELDEEAQGKIAQLLFDQEQKLRGLPTSEEQRIQNLLQGAWNKDGSPFKGQPFDPNSFKVETSGQFPPSHS